MAGSGEGCRASSRKPESPKAASAANPLFGTDYDLANAGIEPDARGVSTPAVSPIPSAVHRQAADGRGRYDGRVIGTPARRLGGEEAIRGPCRT
jgi:hypothetical protein